MPTDPELPGPAEDSSGPAERSGDGGVERVRVRVRKPSRTFQRRRRRRRLLLAGGAVGVVLLLGALLALDVYRTAHDLRQVDRASDVLGRSLVLGDGVAAGQAGQVMVDSAQDARRRTERPWWTIGAHLPVVGGELTALRDLSRASETIATTSVRPLVQVAPRLPGLLTARRLDVETLRTLREPTDDLSRGIQIAARQVADVDTADLRGPGSADLVDAVDRVRSAARTAGAAAQAAQVLPTLLGGSGTHHYLLVVGNNAETRATDGLPGSWALLTAEDGRLSLDEQGGSGVLVKPSTPILPLTGAERALYTDLLGTDFRDTAFTPDATRAARLQAALWEASQSSVRPGQTPVRLDGVVQLDTVGLSYLLRGTGPVELPSGTRLTEQNAVSTLLSRSYATLGAASDGLFREATKAVFDQATTRPQSILDVIGGLARADREDRMRVIGLTTSARRALDRAEITPDLTGVRGPAALVTFDDGTGSKMSYYLRRSSTAVLACVDGRRTLTGFTRVHQTISAAQGRRLAPYVTGAGRHGVRPGTQRVVIGLYGPRGARLDRVEIDQGDVTGQLRDATWNGRPAAIVPVSVTGTKDVLVGWRFVLPRTSPKGADLSRVWQTPSVVPGSGYVTVDDRCR